MTSPDVSLSSTLGVTSGSPFLIVGSSTGGSLELSAGEMLSPDISALQPPATISAATTGIFLYKLYNILFLSSYE